MWLDKASLNIQTHGQYHALKTQVLVMLVSRNVFHVVSALQSIGSIHFWLIRSLVAPTLAGLSNAVPCSLLRNYEFSDRRSSQIRYAAFLKHGTGHAFECLGWLCPATFIQKLKRAINSRVSVNPRIYSCAVDAFLEISTHLYSH